MRICNIEVSFMFRGNPEKRELNGGVKGSYPQEHA